MQSKRKDWIVTPAVMMLDVALGSYYNLSLHHTDRLRRLKDKPFVLLPNHQHFTDILLEGVLLQRTLGRNADYVMKASLPNAFEYIGGIKIMRGKDVKNGSRKEAAEEKKKVYDKRIPMRLFCGEIVVVHPEGTRSHSSEGDVKRNLRNLLRSQRVIHNYIVFVPLRISYDDSYTFRSNVSMTIGHPIKVDDCEEGLEKLTRHWMTETKYH